MSMFNAPRAPFSQRSPFEGPSAGNQYEGFGGGAVGSVGGRNYGNTPWWMLPAGTQRNPSFMPVAQQPAPAAAPAMPPALQAPVGGGPQDFFAALAGLLSGNKMPGQGFSYAGRHGAGAPNAWARPQMKQISPEIMARISGQGPLQAPSRMPAMPKPVAVNLYGTPWKNGMRPIVEDPTEEGPTPAPRPDPGLEPLVPPRQGPMPNTSEPFEPSRQRPTTGPINPPERPRRNTRRGTGEDVTPRRADGQRPPLGTGRIFGSNRNWNPINPPRKDYKGPGPADFRNWMQQADQEAKARGHTKVSTGTYYDPVTGTAYAM